MKSYIPNESNVKLIGRTYSASNGLWLSYSGTGIEFQASAKRICITITGSPVAEDKTQPDNQARLALYVDGELLLTDMVNQNQMKYTIIDSSITRNTVIRLIKLSECAMSNLCIKSIEADDSACIMPVQPKDKLIEFIGDSITCGYGVDAPDETHPFSTSTEDVTKAYAYKTALALNVDYSIISISGYGIISGYTGDGVKSADQLLPLYYDTLGFSYDKFLIDDRKNAILPSSLKWDFSKREPDIVVINLGTNDHSYCGTDASRQAEFASGYISFLKNVRSRNPHAAILCTLGIMEVYLYECFKEAVDSYQKETGDTNISCFRFSTMLASDGYGADWHPSVISHDKAAAQLIQRIQAIL